VQLNWHFSRWRPQERDSSKAANLNQDSIHGSTLNGKGVLDDFSNKIGTQPKVGKAPERVRAWGLTGCNIPMTDWHLLAYR